MWRHYYERWSAKTIEQLGPEMVGLIPELASFVPPARTYDKHVYSPWTGDLHQQLRSAGIDTLILTRRRDRCLRPGYHAGRHRLGLPHHP
jgi:nicotinamidase-related amidase